MRFVFLLDACHADFHAFDRLQIVRATIWAPRRRPTACAAGVRETAHTTLREQAANI